ncbi:MAG: M3 family oligoendopeptidase [Chloroflexota bacterium]|nr:M3 family oligoendopeptidase [Chloroflexota bacterium]
MTASATTDRTALPRWDLTPVFPALDSPAFADAFATLLSDLSELDGLLADAENAESDPQAMLEDALARLNDVSGRQEVIWAYLYGLITTNSRNDLAQSRFSELQARSVAQEKALTRLDAWLAGQEIEALIAGSPVAREHAYFLRRAVARSAHLMSPVEEALAADLGPAAGSAWGRLHGNLSSQITVEVDGEQGRERLPMSEVRNLAHHADRQVRARAWGAELAAWRTHALPLAAALNGVKGEVVTLAQRRRWDGPLDEAVFANAIDNEVLEALMGEARASFPEFRRYFKLKAEALGVPALAWYDLFAPMGAPDRIWTWPRATSFIEERFAAFSPRMGGLARRAVAEDWIDAEPRPGKAGGAYCMWVGGPNSRILQNFSTGYDGVSTLAHELGHAYHNLTQSDLPPLLHATPMCLAETASTFCETIIKEAALEDASTAEQVYILEQSLQGSGQIVVDIISRFDFEQAICEKRLSRELSADEFCELMLGAQAGTYGDGLDPEARHPYMWAVKGHYYRPEQSFYNFPYLFGLLFGLGLYAEARRDPSGFPERYDALLRDTGNATASELADRFGIDLRAPQFWRAGLDVVRADIDRLEALLRAS